jgi:3-dehydroquinate synthase
LHGEAVAIGMRLATKLSLQLGYLSIADAERIENLMQNLQLFQLSYVLPSSDKFIALMKQDKKAQAGVISFILVKHIGVAFQHKTITEDQLVSLLS